MKIKFACPPAWFERPDLSGLGDVGETVEVDDELAMRLVQEGYAQVVVSAITAATVDKVAAVEGVDLSDAHTVAEKKAAIKAARNQED
jgi:hypothetical protein